MSYTGLGDEMSKHFITNNKKIIQKKVCLNAFDANRSENPKFSCMNKSKSASSL